MRKAQNIWKNWTKWIKGVKIVKNDEIAYAAAQPHAQSRACPRPVPRQPCPRRCHLHPNPCVVAPHVILTSSNDIIKWHHHSLLHVSTIFYHFFTHFFFPSSPINTSILFTTKHTSKHIFSSLSFSHFLVFMLFLVFS